MSRDTLREALDELRRFAEAHHADEQPHVWLHALLVDIPSRVDAIVAALEAEPVGLDVGVLTEAMKWRRVEHPGGG